MHKDNKESAYIISLKSKKANYYMEETILNIFEKHEIKKNLKTNTEKDNNFERKNNENIVKK